MTKTTLLATVVTMLLAMACSPDEKCSEGQVYIEGWCHNVDDDSGVDTDTQEIPADGGVGLGDECSGDDECNDDADYCALNPMSEDPGYCTYTGCVTDPDNCPLDYQCCNMTVGGISFCATPADIEALGSMCQ